MAFGTANPIVQTTQVVSTIWRQPDRLPGSFMGILVGIDRTEVTGRQYLDYVRSGPPRFDESQTQQITLTWSNRGPNNDNQGVYVYSGMNIPSYLPIGFETTTYWVQIGKPVIVPAGLVPELRASALVSVS